MNLDNRDDEATYQLWEVPEFFYYPEQHWHGSSYFPALSAHSSLGARNLGITILGVGVVHDLKNTVEELQAAKHVLVRMKPGRSTTHVEKMVFGNKCSIESVVYPDRICGYAVVDVTDTKSMDEKKHSLTCAVDSSSDFTHMTVSVLRELRPICVIVRADPIPIFVSVIYRDGKATAQVHYTAKDANEAAHEQVHKIQRWHRTEKEQDVRSVVLEGLLE
jgi:hypothetical protein